MIHLSNTLLFVCVICCTNALSILPETCPEGEVPTVLKFPIGGKTAVQVQIDNPTSRITKPILLFAWFLYDEQQGIRIDIPNPEIFTVDVDSGNTTYPFPILFSIFMPVNNNVGNFMKYVQFFNFTFIFYI